jgi:toxin secretion/phage lysis holin
MIRRWLSEITPLSATAFGAISTLGGALTYLFGAWNKIFVALVVFMAADVITGIMKAIKKKSDKTADGKLSSKAGTEGLFKKIGIFVGIMVAYWAGIMFLPNAEKAIWLRDAVICGFGFFELVSVIENLDALGVKIPPVLMKFIKAIKKKVYAEEPDNPIVTEAPISDEETIYEKESEEMEG